MEMASLTAISRVLIVDDNRTLADILASSLNQNGFEAYAVYSAEQAIEQAIKSRPEFIVMDVIMDEIDGVDAAIAICETLPGIRILLISGHEGAGKRLEKGSLRGHHFDLMMKPIQPSWLVQRLRIQDCKEAAVGSRRAA